MIFKCFMKFSNILISKKQFLCNKKPYKKFQKFHSFHKKSEIEPYVIKQLLHLNLINMRFYGAEYNNIELGIRLVQTLSNDWPTYCQTRINMVFFITFKWNIELLQIFIIELVQYIHIACKYKDILHDYFPLK
jgi:hypothetical protein